MFNRGGSDAESLRNAVNIFYVNDRKILINKYCVKVILITMIGASINTGKISGLVTIMEIEN